MSQLFQSIVKVFGAAALSVMVMAGSAFANSEPAAWDRQDFNIKGTWSIVEDEGKKFVVLSDDFKTRNAPDLKLFLTPKAVDDVTGANATENSVLISELSSNKGGQRYEIPEGIDLADYQSILIHCERFSKLWGGSALPK